MKYLAPILLTFSIVMACFTDPQGVNGIWIVPSQVVAILHPVDCASGAHTKIITQSGAFCVIETPAQVRQRLDDTER